MRKRLLAIIATVAMVVAMMPSMVFGATTVSNLTELRTALANGGTVVLGDNISMGESDTTIEIPAGVTVTLDLNGKTLSQTKAATSPGYQVILNDGNLTIKDGVGTGKISYTDSGSGGEYISDTIYNRATLVIDGGTIENLSSATVASNGYPHAVDTYSGIRDTSTTINGGTIYCENYSAIRMFCVSATYKADLVINGGTIKGAVDMQNGTVAKALGTLTINGGTFETTANPNNIRFANWNMTASDEYGLTASIEGGEFDGGITSKYVPAAANWNKKVVSGGTFGTNISEYVADDAAIVVEDYGDGKYGYTAVASEEEAIAAGATFKGEDGKYYVSAPDGVTGNVIAYRVSFYVLDAKDNNKIVSTLSDVVVPAGKTINDAKGTEEYVPEAQNGYEFAGWWTVDHNGYSYDGEVGTLEFNEYKAEVNFDTVIDSDMELFAKWTVAKSNAGGNEGTVTPEKPDTEEPAEEPEDEVDTGDNMNVVIPFAIAALALAAMGTVVAARRRHN